MGLSFEQTTRNNLFDSGIGNSDGKTPDYLSTFAKEDFSNKIHANRSKREDTGSLTDAFIGFTAGGIESFSFGAIRPDDYFGYSEDEQTLAYRLGKGAGTAASMVAPIGPFGLIARGGNAAIRATKGSTAIAKEAIKQTSKKFATGSLTTNVINKELKKQLLKNDASKRYLTQHGINAEELAKNNKLLQDNLAASLKAGFEKSGQQVSDRVVTRITRDIADQLRKPGVHLNTIEDYVQSLTGSSGFAGKFAGMAAQDFYVFMMHNTITSGIGSFIHGDEIGTMSDIGKRIAGNLALSGAFPLIRAIPGGGKYTLRQGADLFKTKTGLNTFRNNFMRQDYKKLVSTKQGEEDARGLIAMMLKGSDLNARNYSLLGGYKYKVTNADKTTKEIGINTILNNLADPKRMPKEQVVQILNQMRKHSDKAFNKWGAGYLAEMANVGQLSRMVLGMFAMNAETWAYGGFEGLTIPETFQHLAIGAMMAKSRGLWDKDNVSNWARDLSNYKELSYRLNMDTSNLHQLVKAYNKNTKIGETFGISMKNTAVGSGIYDIVYADNAKNDQTYTDVADGLVPPEKVEYVNQMIQVAQTMKSGVVRDPSLIDNIDVRRLSKARIEELYDNFRELEFKDGSSLKDFSAPDVFSHLQIEASEGIGNKFKAYLLDVAEATGYPLVYNETSDKLEVFPVEFSADDFSVNGQYQHNLLKFNDFILNLESHGLITRKSNTEFKQSYFVKDNKVVRESVDNVDVASKLEDITEGYINNIVKGALGQNNAYFDILSHDNPMLKQWLSGNAAKNRDRIYKISQGRTTGDDRFATPEQQFIDVVGNVFRLNNQRATGPIDDIDKGAFIARPPKIIADETTSDKESKSPAYIDKVDNTQLKLNNIYEVMRAGHTGRIEQSGQQHKIPLKDAEAFVEMYENLGLHQPSDPLYDFGYYNDLQNYVARRALAAQNFNSESLAIVVAARDNGLFDLENQTIMSPKAVADALIANNEFSANDPEYRALVEKYEYIFNKISNHPSIKISDDLMIGMNNELISAKSIESIFNVTQKGLSGKIFKDVNDAINNIKSSLKTEELAEIGAEIIRLTEDVTTYIDQLAMTGAQAGDPTIQKALVDFQDGYTILLENINNKVAGSQVVKAEISKMVNELTLIQKVYNENPAIAGQNKYNPATLLTMGESIQRVLLNEKENQIQAVETLERIASLKNHALGGGELLKLHSMLLRKLSVDLNRPEMVTTMSVNEAIAEYTNNKSFENLNNVVKLVQSVAAQRQSMKQFERDITENASKLEDIVKDKAHNRNDTPMHIIRKFNLHDTENPNQLSMQFIEMLNDYVNVPNPENENKLNQFIVDRVSAIYGAPGSKDFNSAYSELMVQWPVLSKQFASMNHITTEYTINGNKIDYDNSMPVRKTLLGVASDFIQSFNFEGLGYINNNITRDGRKGLLKDYSKEDLENIVNNTPVIDKMLADRLLNNPEDAEFIVSESQETGNKSRESNFIFDGINKMVLDVHAGNPLLIPISDNNIKSINDKFEVWYDNKLERLDVLSDTATKRNFVKSVESLVSKLGSENAQAKMILMSLDVVNSAGFDKIFSPEMFPTNDITNQRYMAHADKLLKISKQSDNTNYVKFANKDLDGLTNLRGIDPELSRISSKFKSNGIKIQLITDEDMGRLKENLNYPTSNRKQVFDMYNEIVTNKDNKYSEDHVNAAKETLAELEAMGPESSLASSILDGSGIIIDPDFSYFNGSIHGDKNLKAFKNNISYSSEFLGSATGHQGIISKFFLHENPMISNDKSLYKLRKAGVTIVMGESSAKAFYGLDRNGGKIIPYELDQNKNFIENLASIPADNMRGVMEIPFESMGFGYAAKPGEQVILPHSVTDFMNANQIYKYRTQQALLENIRKLNSAKSNLERFEDETQALVLFDRAVEQTGYDFSAGELGLAQMALKSGIFSHHNPIIRKGVMNLFNGLVFDKIRRPLTNRGQDTYIIPDAYSEHPSPTFRTVYENTPISKTSDVKNRKVFRVVNNFGYTSIADRMGKTPIRSMNDLDFVANINGRDIIFRYDGKNLQIIDHISDMAKAHKGKGYYFGGDITPQKPLDDYSLSKSELESLELFVKSYDSAIFKSDNIDYNTLTLKGMVDLLSKGTYDISDANNKIKTIDLSKNPLMYIAKKYDIGLGVQSLAIPKKSFDLGFNRIKSVLSEDFGNLSIINAHDLRIMHQRDFDGDHLYQYSGNEFEVLRYAVARMGVIEDYDILPRTPQKSNILGFDKNGTVGAVPSEMGMTNLKKGVFANQYGIGETVTLKNLTNMARNIGIEFNHKDGTISEFREIGAVDGINRLFTDPEFLAAKAMAVLNQNEVDYWGGKHALAEIVKEAILTGDVPKKLKDQLPFEIKGVISNAEKFRQRSNQNNVKSNSINEANLYRDSRDIILNALKRASAIMNNPFNEGGQFTPTDWYLKNSYNDLRAFLQNPNEYIVRRLFSKYRGNRSVLNEIVNMFYNPKAKIGLNERSSAEFIINNARKGNVPSPDNKLITFKNGVRGNKGYKNVKELMSIDNSTYLLNEVNDKGLIRDKDYYGDMLETNDLSLSDVVSLSGNLLNRVMMYKAYFPNLEPHKAMNQDMATDDYFDMQMPLKVSGTKKQMSWKDVEVRSVTKHILEKDASRLRVEIAKMKGLPGRVNEYEKTVLETKLGDIESTLKVLDDISVKSIFDQNNITGKKPEDNIFTSFYKKTGKQTHRGKGVFHLYRVKGLYLNTDSVKNLNFKQLEYIDKIKPGDMTTYYKGYTYIRVNNPLQRRYIGDNESLHALGLFDYINATTHAEQVVKRHEVSEFYDSVYEMHKIINEDYHLTRRALKDEPASKAEAFEWASRRDKMELESWLNRWNKKPDNMENLSDDQYNAIVNKDIKLLKLLIKPLHASGQYVSVDNFDLPYLYMNKQIQKVALNYLVDAEYVEMSNGKPILPPEFEKMYDHQRIYVKTSQNIKTSDQDMIRMEKHRQSAMQTKDTDFFRLGEVSSSAEYLFMDWGYVDWTSHIRLPEMQYPGKVYKRSATNSVNKKTKQIFKKKRKNKRDYCVNK